LNLAVVGEVKEEKKLSSVLGFISEVGRVKWKSRIFHFRAKELV
jgi:hypothetical protein